MTVIVVLALISITMALSYAMMRTQTTSLRIQSNHDRRGQARQAAITGMNVALRKMHEADWAGVDAEISGTLSDTESFTVSMTTGDASLGAGDADFAKYPYRVTLLSTGASVDPADSNARSTHQVQSVVQLVPRRLASAPLFWPATEPFTVFQWGRHDTSVHVPARIEGPVLLQKELKFCEDYPGEPALTRYLEDLDWLRMAGHRDDRPFTGPIFLPFGDNDVDTLRRLNGALGLVVGDVASVGIGPASHPGRVSSYRLYPGGKEYEVPLLPATLTNAAFEPDPTTNPLGVLGRIGRVDVYDNVRIEGTVITSGSQPDIYVFGDNVTFSAPTLPALIDDPATGYQLPAALVADDMCLGDGTTATVSGLVVAWDDFEISEGTDRTAFSLDGRLVTYKLKIGGRTEWNDSQVDWDTAHADFDAVCQQAINEADETPVNRYFPLWIEANKGLPPAPRLHIRGGPENVKYHFHDWDQPVFVPHPDDEGLRWDLIRWTDNP